MDKKSLTERLGELRASREQAVLAVSAHDGAMGEIQKLLKELETDKPEDKPDAK